MANGKDRGRDQCDESKDDKDITMIIDVPQRSEELRTKVHDPQWNQVKQRYVENEELGNSQQEFLRQEAMSPPPTNVRETLNVRFSKLEPKEFKGSMDPYEAEDWLYSTQAILEAMELGDREKI